MVARKILETPAVLGPFLGLGIWTRACQFNLCITASPVILISRNLVFTVSSLFPGLTARALGAAP